MNATETSIPPTTDRDEFISFVWPLVESGHLTMARMFELAEERGIR